MIIYQGTTEDFIDDTIHNRVADIMSDRFKENLGRNVSTSEFNSWNNSSQYLKNIIELGELKHNYICLEYPVPYTGERIDCLLFGKSEEEKAFVVLMELKQWSDVKSLEIGRASCRERVLRLV